MAVFVLIDKDRIRPVPGTQIIKAADAAVIAQAEDILDEARKRAERIVEDARVAFNEEKTRGFDEGCRLAKKEMAIKIIETSLNTERHYQELKTQTLSLVMAIVKKVLWDIDPKELVVAQVANALRSINGCRQLTLKVSPENADTVREKIATLSKHCQGIDIIEVESSSQLSTDDLILESDTGIVDASLSVQLSAIETAFRSASGLQLKVDHDAL